MDGVNKRENFDVADTVTIAEVMDIGVLVAIEVTREVIGVYDSVVIPTG